MQLAIAYFGERSDGNLASSAETVEKRTLASCRSARCGGVEKCEMLTRGLVALANFESKRTLARCRAHDFRGKNLPHQLRLAESLDAGDGQNDGVILSLCKLAQTGVNVAAKRVNIEIGANGFELRLAAEARSADARAVRQVFDFHEMARAESVTSVFAFCDGGQFKSGGKFGGQIFE